MGTPPWGLRGVQGLAETGWQCEPPGWAGEYFGVQRWGCCGDRAPVMLQPHLGRGGDRAGVSRHKVPKSPPGHAFGGRLGCARSGFGDQSPIFLGGAQRGSGPQY